MNAMTCCKITHCGFEKKQWLWTVYFFGVDLLECLPCICQQANGEPSLLPVSTSRMNTCPQLSWPRVSLQWPTKRPKRHCPRKAPCNQGMIQLACVPCSTMMTHTTWPTRWRATRDLQKANLINPQTRKKTRSWTGTAQMTRHGIRFPSFEFGQIL